METLHARYGRLPWGELFAPAIALAEDGFPVSPRLAAAIAEANEHGLDDFPAGARALLPPGRHARWPRARSCATPTSPAPSA